MNEVTILVAALVVAGIYITYCHHLLAKADETIDNLVTIIQGVADGSVKVEMVEDVYDGED